MPENQSCLITLGGISRIILQQTLWNGLWDAQKIHLQPFAN